MSLKSSSRVAVGLAISAALAGTASAQFQVSIGVRETNNNVGIGNNGGTTGAGTSIEWVNLDGQSLSADGQWHTFTWNFGTDPVTTFAGTQPAGGATNRLDGTWGVLENLRFRNIGGTTDPIALYIDDLTNTPSGGSPTVFEDFESYASVATPTNAAPEVVFRDPRFSGSTNTFLLTNDTGNVSSTEASSGLNSYRMGFQFQNSTTSNWIRMTTNNTATRGNPALDISTGSTFSLRLKAVVTPVLLGWNVDGDGDWTNAANWAGPVPNSNSGIARFGGAAQITAPRTVTVDTTVTSSSLIFNSAVPYTINAAEAQGILLRAPAGFTTLLNVENGNHIINAPMEAGIALSINTAKATDTLTINGALTATDSESISVTKSGLGTASVKNVRFNALTVSAGKLVIAADGTDAGVSEVNSLSFAGGSNPTSKLDITNNAMIVDWDTAAVTPRPNAVFSVRGRIVNGFNGGDWLGNGISSSTAAANAGYAIGYGDAATLAITTFGGRAVDAEATLVLYTRRGDSDLDRDVDFDDLLKLAQNYDPAYDPNGANGPKLWTENDNNYDGIVNFDDLLALAQNYGAAPLNDTQLSALGGSFAADWALALSIVPEPTSLSLLGGAATLLVRRRR